MNELTVGAGDTRGSVGAGLPVYFDSCYAADKPRGEESGPVVNINTPCYPDYSSSTHQLPAKSHFVHSPAACQITPPPVTSNWPDRSSSHHHSSTRQLPVRSLIHSPAANQITPPLASCQPEHSSTHQPPTRSLFPLTGCKPDHSSTRQLCTCAG